MSAIALLLARQGHRVSGSELRQSAVTEQLANEGVTLSREHGARLVEGADVVVHSTAIPVDHVELKAARDREIPVHHRSAILAALCSRDRSVGVAGTHGKTTTTALLTHMLSAANVAYSAVVGAEINGAGIGAISRGRELFVVEADESDGTLDVLAMNGLIVTNVDKDHLDYLGSLEGVQECFAEAISRSDGPVVLNCDDPASAPLFEVPAARTRVLGFGRDQRADVRVVSVAAREEGLHLVVDAFGRHVEGRIPLHGEHNALNLVAALCMAHQLGVPPASALESVCDFPGVGRRFSERGMFNGALLIDDYAHLPAEINAALLAARDHPRRRGKVVAVFQPNRFHRIASMAGDYAECFDAADAVVITEIYASGTTPIEGVSGILVHDAVREARPTAALRWAPTREAIVSAVGAMLEPGDVCISMGCGDIETFPDDLRLGAR